MTLPHEAFAFYDVKSHGWTVEPGQFEIAVGKSSRDLPLKQTIDVK
jgi:beta-glucosidase